MPAVVSRPRALTGAARYAVGMNEPERTGPVLLGMPIELLDLEDVASGPYDLEVSSPGVERPLKRPRDFQRHTGEKVKVRSVEPVDGSTTHVGMLERADEDGIVVRT